MPNGPRRSCDSSVEIMIGAALSRWRHYASYADFGIRFTGPHTNRAWRATSAPSVSDPKATRSKNSWRNSAPRSSVPILI
jgi:hypothetical protein